MDFSNQATEFSGGIQELSFDEIDAVNGGWVIVLVAAVAMAGCVILGYEAAHQRAEAAEG